MRVQRFFIPGSEWLYFKIYTGYKSADDVLVDYLLPFFNDLKDNKKIDDYFFIRYTDPQFHIRVRLHVNDVLNYGFIFKEFANVFAPCLDSGLIWNIQCDTYKRELERYGEVYINEVERIFCVDSESIIRLIQIIRDSDAPDEDRWKLSLLLLDDLLCAFGFELFEKYLFFKQIGESFKKEFGFVSSLFTKQLNNKFRINRNIVNSVMDNSYIYLDKYEEILTNRRSRIADVFTFVSVGYDLRLDLARSLAHMTMNRLFRSKNRLYELVIYNFLSRYYGSKIARLKSSR